MCTRISPISMEEAQAVAESHSKRGRARVMMDPHALNPIHDAHPGDYVACLVTDGYRGLTAQNLTWGFDLEGKRCAVFIARIERPHSRPAAPGSTRPVDGGHSPWPLSRARARVLRKPRH